MNGSALVGKVFEGLYPAANYRGIRPRLERRRFRVIEVRDLRERPLDPVTVELDPNLDRGQTLLKAWDLDKDAERQFYLERLSDLRIGCEQATRPADDGQCIIVIDGARATVAAPKGRMVYQGVSPMAAAAFAQGFNSGDDGRYLCAVVVSPEVSPRPSAEPGKAAKRPRETRRKTSV